MHVGIQLRQAEALSLASMVHAIADHCERNPDVAAFLDNKGSPQFEGVQYADDFMLEVPKAG